MNNYKVGGVANLLSQGFPVKKNSNVIKKKQLKKEVNSVKVKSEIKQKKLKKLQKEVEVKPKKRKNVDTSEIEPKPKKKKKVIVEGTNSNVVTKPKKKEGRVGNTNSGVVTKLKKKKVIAGNTNFNQVTKPKNKKDIVGDTNSDVVTKLKKKKKILTNENTEPEKEKEMADSLKKKEKKKEKKKGKVPTKFEVKDFVENTVFVGNLPLNYEKPKVYKIFSKFGKIRSIRIRCIPIADINMSKKIAAVKKQFNSNRNSVVAYVKYQNKDAAEAAVAANGMVVDGHHLRIDFAEENKERDNNKAVFVGGLPFDTEDDELWELFQNCGKINSVRIIRDSHTTMGKGFGYVNFDSTSSVELALQLDGHQLKKRTINVKRCVNVKKKNKFNTFDTKKTREITSELLAKKGKKAEKKKFKKEKDKRPPKPTDFQGRKANIKQKKKKKPSKVVLRHKKIMKILGTA